MRKSRVIMLVKKVQWHIGRNIATKEIWQEMFLEDNILVISLNMQIID